MDSLLNASRPAVFCPGCAHEQVLRALDKTLIEMGYHGKDVAIVSDIGCSGLFDTFFNTHAFHGLHGRALTYATGIKMARPDSKVIVTMGDGGLGIGGAHVLSTCRRNIDLTLLVLNNFNYGMTGGQCSSTTPNDAVVGSGFLNKLEKPMDICRVAGAAGAPMVLRASTYRKDLGDTLRAAIAFDGFSLVDIWGICPGRYTRRNKLTPKDIEAKIAQMPAIADYKEQNARMEYGKAYRREAAKQKMPAGPLQIEKTAEPPKSSRNEIVLLGSAGQRILTAGELLCLAGAAAGCHVTQKNDYPITVMRGHSVSEVILSDVGIDFTGIENPAVVVALAAEGVNRRKKMFASLSQESMVIKAAGVELPACPADIVEVDFKAKKIKTQDYALAALAVMAQHNRVLNMDMLHAALKLRFKQSIFETAVSVVEKFLQNFGKNF
jgi:pyruvate/2-oxoacid:ferredoxin oxidoreductase beta subunit/Pyruvate/2-oxoacid:ferredoxin oxidoreductase gamma subunit